MTVKTTPQVFIDSRGDIEQAKTLIGFALNQRSILENLMSFNSLSQDQRQINLDDGSTIFIQSCYGIDKIWISSPKVIVPIEEEELYNELLEVINQDSEWQYWNPKTDTFFDIPGNDGSTQKAFSSKKDFSTWCLTLKGKSQEIPFIPSTQEVVRNIGGVDTVVTLNLISYADALQNRCRLCEAYTDHVCIGAKTAISSGWFVYRSYRSHFWQEIKEIYEGYAIVEKLFPGESRYWSEVADEYVNVFVTFSPYVPLYETIETSTVRGVQGPMVITETWCGWPGPYYSGTSEEKPDGWIYCDDRFHYGANLADGSSPNIEPDRVGYTFVPWIEEFTDDGIGDAYAYHYYEALPCSGGGSSTDTTGSKNANSYKLTACNVLDFWEHIASSPLEFDITTDVAIDYEQEINYTFQLNPITGAAEIVGCNDGERTYNSTNTAVSGSCTRDYIKNGATSPFGEWSESKEQHDELVWVSEGTWEPATWPALPTFDSFYSSLNGLFSKHTIVSVFSQIHYDPETMTASWKGDSKKETTLGISPLSVKSSSALNTVQVYSPQFELVIAPGGLQNV